MSKFVISLEYTTLNLNVECTLIVFSLQYREMLKNHCEYVSIKFCLFSEKAVVAYMHEFWRLNWEKKEKIGCYIFSHNNNVWSLYDKVLRWDHFMNMRFWLVLSGWTVLACIWLFLAVFDCLGLFGTVFGCLWLFFLMGPIFCTNNKKEFKENKFNERFCECLFTSKYSLILSMKIKPWFQFWVIFNLGRLNMVLFIFSERWPYVTFWAFVFQLIWKENFFKEILVYFFVYKKLSGEFEFVFKKLSGGLEFELNWRGSSLC